MNQATPLDGAEDVRRAAVALIGSVRRHLHLYTPHIDPRLFEDVEVIDAIRSQIVQQPRTRFYFILPPAAEWRRDCPGLLRLSERLSSALELRTLAKDEPRERPEFGQAFFIADQAALLLLTDPRRLVGSHDQQGAAKTRELINFFMEIWEKSQPDPELRRLGL